MFVCVCVRVCPIQASRQQILSELHSVHAIELDGVWRSVDPAYLGQLLELVILK